jgi:hypothetical protein
MKKHKCRSPTLIKERLRLKWKREDEMRGFLGHWSMDPKLVRNKYLDAKRQLGTVEKMISDAGTGFNYEFRDLLHYCAPKWKMGKEALNDLWHEIDLMKEKISKAQQHHHAVAEKPSVLTDRASWEQPGNFMQAPFD